MHELRERRRQLEEELHEVIEAAISKFEQETGLTPIDIMVLMRSTTCMNDPNPQYRLAQVTVEIHI